MEKIASRSKRGQCSLQTSKLRQTGNAMDLQYDIPEVSKRVLDIVGREHNNGLALLSELGFPRVKKCKHILNIC